MSAGHGLFEVTVRLTREYARSHPARTVISCVARCGTQLQFANLPAHAFVLEVESLARRRLGAAPSPGYEPVDQRDQEPATVLS